MSFQGDRLGASFTNSYLIERRVRELSQKNEAYEVINGNYSVVLDQSIRKGFLIQNNTNIVLKVPQPQNDLDGKEFHFVFCNQNTPRQIQLDIESLNEFGNPYSGQITFVNRQKTYKKNAQIQNNQAGFFTGTYNVVSGTFQGDIFVNLYSCGKGPDGNYMYQGEIEVYNA